MKKAFLFLLLFPLTCFCVELDIQGIGINSPLNAAFLKFQNNKVLQKHVSSIKNLEYGKAFSIGLYSFVSSNENDQIQEILLHGSVVDLIFDAWDLTPSQFAKTFMATHNINQMEFDGQNWFFIDSQNNKITISKIDKAMTLRTLNQQQKSNIAPLLKN